MANTSGKRVDVYLGKRTCPRAFNMAQEKHAYLPIASNFYINTAGAREDVPVRWIEVLMPGHKRANLFDEKKQEEIFYSID